MVVLPAAVAQALAAEVFPEARDPAVRDRAAPAHLAAAVDCRPSPALAPAELFGKLGAVAAQAAVVVPALALEVVLEALAALVVGRALGAAQARARAPALAVVVLDLVLGAGLEPEQAVRARVQEQAV